AGAWRAFRAFESSPSLDRAASAATLVDMTGDGLPDVVVLDEPELRWYRGRGRDGFEAARAAAAAPGAGSDAAPTLVSASPERAVFFADMSGDGLADLVELTATRVRYWPMLGYGRLGRPVTMDGFPALDRPDRFDARRVQVTDIDGSGPTDLIYLGSDGVLLLTNETGNSFATPRELRGVPPVDQMHAISTTDL